MERITFASHGLPELMAFLLMTLLTYDLGRQGTVAVLLLGLPPGLFCGTVRGSWTEVSVCCCSPHQNFCSFIKSKRTDFRDNT